MASLTKVISEGDVGATSLLASKLFTRHGAFGNWSTLWWQTIIASTQAIDNSVHSAVVAAATAHIQGVAGQADDEFQPIVSDWLDSLTPTDALEALSHPTSLTILWILVNCCAHRLIRLSSKILERLAFPIWTKVAKGALAGGIPASDLKSLENSLIVSQQLLLTEPPSRMLPPNNLRQALVLQTERGDALNGKNVVNLIQHLPFLVVLEQSKSISSAMKRQISLLLEQLSMTPQFKSAAFRNLEVLKDAFLSSEWSQSPLENLEAGMVDVLKMIMSQGSQSQSPLPSGHVSS